MVMFGSRRSMTFQLERVSLCHPQVPSSTSKSQLAFTRDRSVVVGRGIGVRVIGTVMELGTDFQHAGRSSLTVFALQRDVVDGNVGRPTQTRKIG